MTVAVLDWLIGQSLLAGLVVIPVLLIGKIPGCRGPKVGLVLWGLVVLRFALPGNWVLAPGFDLGPTIGEVTSSHLMEPPGALAAAESTPTEALDTTHPVAGALVSVWLALVCLLALHSGRRRATFRRIVRNAPPCRDPRVTRLIDRWRGHHRIRRPTTVVWGDAGVGPFTMGTLRPIVYLPRSIVEGDGDALEASIAHELAHVAALDDLAIHCQRVIGILFFFHPVMWLTGRRLDEHRELARDLAVIKRGRFCSRRYGKGLLRAVTDVGRPALGMAALGTRLSTRIRALAARGAVHEPEYLPSMLLILGLLSLPVIGFGHRSPAPGAPGLESRWWTPIPEGTVSSGFGPRRGPFTGESVHHRGVDIVAAQGRPIVASRSGRVSKSVRQPGDSAWGKQIVLQHEGGYQSIYAHLDKVFVEKGEAVEQGTIIGTVGSTGRVTGPHLHFEIHLDGRALDPSTQIPLIGKD